MSEIEQKFHEAAKELLAEFERQGSMVVPSSLFDAMRDVAVAAEECAKDDAVWSWGTASKERRAKLLRALLAIHEVTIPTNQSQGGTRTWQR